MVKYSSGMLLLLLSGGSPPVAAMATKAISAFSFPLPPYLHLQITRSLAKRLTAILISSELPPENESNDSSSWVNFELQFLTIGMHSF